MDTLDVQREANKDVIELARQTMMELKRARTTEKECVIRQYQIAVEYRDFPKGAKFRAAYLKGWRKGYGF